MRSVPRAGRGPSPRKQPQQARARATLDAIVAAASQVFSAEGFRDASVARIAKVAGVSAGSLYQYFPTKEALLAEVMERHSDQMIAYVEPRLLALASSSVKDGCAPMMEVLIEAYCLDADLIRTLLGESSLAGTGHAAREFDRRLRGALQVYLESHRASLDLKSPERAVRTLVPAVQAVLREWLLDPSTLARDELAQELCRLVLRYLGVT